MTMERRRGVWEMIRPLPARLDEVAAFRRTKATGGELSLFDPQTGAPYELRVTGEKTYELCATFTTERRKATDLFWNHSASRHCFSFNAEFPP